jgi:hypothetical protein
MLIKKLPFAGLPYGYRILATVLMILNCNCNTIIVHATSLFREGVRKPVSNRFLSFKVTFIDGGGGDKAIIH